MRIKSGVWYWLAVASGAVGMLYALGFAGSIEALGVISDTDFITAMVLLLLALFFVQLGDHAAEREVQRRRYIDRRHARTEAPEYRLPEGRMKTKRMKKLLMGMGLSRNQVNHMVKEQRLKALPKSAMQPITTPSTASLSSRCWRDWLPYVKSLVLE